MNYFIDKDHKEKLVEISKHRYSSFCSEAQNQLFGWIFLPMELNKSVALFCAANWSCAWNCTRVMYTADSTNDWTDGRTRICFCLCSFGRLFLHFLQKWRRPWCPSWQYFFCSLGVILNFLYCLISIRLLELDPIRCEPNIWKHCWTQIKRKVELQF